MTAVGFEVASAYVSISPNLQNFRRTIRRELDTALTGTVTDPLRREVARAETAARPGLGRLGGLIKTSIGAAATAGAVGLGAAVAGLVALGVTGVKTASQLQQAEVAYSTLLGSATLAKSTLKDLAEFARRTPFDTTQVVDSGKKLLAFGFTAEQLIPVLTTLGDAAAATGLGADGIDRLVVALGQIKAKGRVQAQELLQIQETGIPATRILADSLGVTQAKLLEMTEKGLVPADFAVSALLRGMKDGTATVKGFAGLMAEQSQTLEGVWSNFKDSTRLALAEGIAPFLPQMTAALSNLVPVVQSLARSFSSALGPALAGLAERVGPAFAQIGESLGPALGEFLGALGPLIASAAPALGALAVAVTKVATAVAIGLKPAWDVLAPVMEQVLAVLAPALVRVIDALAPSFLDIAQAVGDVTLALLPLIPPLTDLIIAVLPVAVTGIKAIAAAIPLAVRAFGFLGNVVSNVGQFMINMTALVLRGILQMVGGILGALAKVPGPQQAAFQAASQGFTSFYTAVDGAIDNVNEKLDTLQDTLWQLAEGVTVPITVDVRYNPEDEGLPRARNARRTTVADAPKPTPKPTPTRDLTSAFTVVDDAATKAQQAMDEWRQEVEQFKRSVQDAITSFGAVTGFTARGLFAPTAGQVVADMRARVAKARMFFGLIRRLRTLGLNRASLLEIISAGPTSGYEIAQALLSGGAGAINEVNRLESQLQASGAQLGGLAASVKYDGTAPPVLVDVYIGNEKLDGHIDTRIAANGRNQQQAARRGSRTS